MIATAQVIFLVLAAIFGFRWQLLYLDIPGDALYRALVLEIVRLGFVLLPFGLYFFKRPTQITNRYILVVAMWAAAIYLIYFSVFLPAGFNFSAIEVFGQTYTRPINLAKTLMFLVWGCMGFVALWTLLRLRVNT